MRVRPAEVNDIPRLMAIAHQSPSAAQWSEREYHALFPGAGAHEGVPKRICLVVETTPEIAAVNSSSGSTIAGFVVARCLGPEWEIENIAVDSAFRRQGCANLLMRELLDRAVSEDVRRVLLEVRESNESARGLYARWGFQSVGRRRGYYRDPEEDAILLHFQCISHVP